MLRAPPEECSPDLCGAGEPHPCACLYKRSSNYSHALCLAPGPHELTLHDAMGFGWLGAQLSLDLKGFGRVHLVEQATGEPAEQATIHSADGTAHGTCGNIGLSELYP